MEVTISHRGETKRATDDTWQNVVDEMVGRLGAWEPGVSTVTRSEQLVTTPPTDAAADAYGQPAKRNSSFNGELVMDAEARERIERTHAALRAGGVKGIEQHGDKAGGQLYATGTRMADVGYSNQAKRAAEHAAKLPIKDAAAQLVERVRAEKRRDVEMTAGEMASKLTMNGSLKFDGFKVREQAIRGVLGRIKSPALGYVLGVRDRMLPFTTDDGKVVHPSPEHPADAAALLDVMKRELSRFENVKLKLRMRDGLGDVFAIMSPDYAPADAPDVLPDVLAAFPSARATFSYDPTTTAWELRAHVFMPTPVEEQAVGEAFEGYVSAFSKDNGTGKFNGGGGIILLACLNAGTYVADSSNVSRRHVGKILVDIAAMMHDASGAIRTLCDAWGVARGDVIDFPRASRARSFRSRKQSPGSTGRC